VTENQTDQATEINTNPITPAQFTAEEFEQLLDVYKRNDPTDKTGEKGLVSALVSEIRAGKPFSDDYFSEEALYSGKAKWLETVELGQDKLKGQRLNAPTILSLLATDMEGRPVQEGTVKGGLKSGFIPGMVSTGAFATGFYTTNAALQLNPLTAVPVTIPQAAARVILPTAVGIYSSIMGLDAGSEISKKIIGTDPIILPGSKYKFAAGKSISENASLALLPYAAYRNINLGPLAIANTFTPVVTKKSFLSGKKKIKAPISFKITRGYENFLNRMRNFAYERPGTFLALEGSAVAGAGIARAGAEQKYPGDKTMAAVAEGFGGFSGGLFGDFFIRNIVDGMRGIKTAYSTVKEEGGVGPLIKGTIDSLRGKNENEVANFLIDFIERNGGDVEKIIKNLTDENLGKMLKQYQEKTGVAVNLTSGVASRSPAILALEKALELTSQGIAQQRDEANTQGIEAIRTGLLAIYGLGDPRTISMAAENFKFAFEGQMETILNARLKDLNKSFDKLKTGVDTGDELENLAVYGNKVYEMIKRLKANDRAKESMLWGNINKGLVVENFLDPKGNQTNVPNFITIFNKIKSPHAAPESYQKDMEILSSLEDFKNRKQFELGLDPERMPDEVAPVTMGELLSMYSKALSIARENPNNDFVRGAASKFARAVLRDINSLPEGTNVEYDIARAYSKAFNDVYTRTYVNEVTRLNKAGGLFTTPEELGRKIYQTDSAVLRVKEFDDIGQFQLNALFSKILGGEESAALLKSAEDAALNKETGVFEFEELRKWTAENRAQLENLPGVAIFREADETVAELGTSAYDNVMNILQSSKDIRATGNNIIRLIRSEAFDPQDPTKVSVPALKKWMNKDENKRLLEIFPDLNEDLLDIINGDTGKLTLFQRAQQETKDTVKRATQGFSFQSLLPDQNIDSPTNVIMEAIKLTNPAPITNLDRLYSVIKNAPQSWTSPITNETFTKADAIAGFKNSILDSIFINSGAGTPSFNATKAYRQLFTPLPKAKNKQRISEWLVENEVYTKAEMKNIEELFGQMVELEQTIFKGSAADVDTLMTKMGPSADLILSVLGSSAGTRLQALIPGDSGTGSLIAAGRGAQVFREAYKNVFASMPNFLKMDLLRDIVSDKDLLATVLRKGKTEQEKKNIGNKLAGYLVDRLFAGPLRRQIPAFSVGDFQQPQDFKPEVPEVQEEQTNVNVREPVLQRQSPNVQPNITNISQVSPTLNPVQNTQPVNRQRFAALFPEDRALIEGIGSLRG